MIPEATATVCQACNSLSFSVPQIMTIQVKRSAFGPAMEHTEMCHVLESWSFSQTGSVMNHRICWRESLLACFVGSSTCC